MDWTILGVVVSVSALLSGWYWWLRPRQTAAKTSSIGSISIGKKGVSENIDAKIEAEDADGEVGNIKLGPQARVGDIKLNVVSRKGKVK